MLLYYSTKSNQWFYNEEDAKKHDSDKIVDNKDELSDIMKDFDDTRRSYMQDKKSLQYKYEERLKSDINKISDLLDA